ncbi:hypothetical protein EJB05_48711, partial [Eragrostis curvula]
MVASRGFCLRDVAASLRFLWHKEEMQLVPHQIAASSLQIRLNPPAGQAFLCGGGRIGSFLRELALKSQVTEERKNELERNMEMLRQVVENASGDSEENTSPIEGIQKRTDSKKDRRRRGRVKLGMEIQRGQSDIVEHSKRTAEHTIVEQREKETQNVLEVRTKSPIHPCE